MLDRTSVAVPLIRNPFRVGRSGGSGEAWSRRMNRNRTVHVKRLDPRPRPVAARPLGVRIDVRA